MACATDCPVNTTVYPGQYAYLSSANKGMCSYSCSGLGTSMSSCPNTGAQISSISTVFPTLCNAGYIDNGYNCIAKTTNSPLQPSKCKYINFIFRWSIL